MTRQVYILPQAAMGKPTMTRADAWKQRDCVLRYRAWCDALRRVIPNPPPAETVNTLWVTARFAMPDQWGKKRKAATLETLRRIKPDGDNILKSICDALWDQDQKLGDIFISRKWGIVDETSIVIETVKP